MKLIALLAEALEAREIIFANPEMAMNALAKREGRCRTRLARLVGISCIAPELVQLSVEGRQPDRFTADALQSATLAMVWKDKVRALNIAS